MSKGNCKQSGQPEAIDTQCNQDTADPVLHCATIIHTWQGRVLTAWFLNTQASLEKGGGRGVRKTKGGREATALGKTHSENLNSVYSL